MKSALYITTRLFWPSIDGHKTNLRNQCKALTEMGYKVYLCSFVDNNQRPEDKPNYIASLELLETVSKTEIICNLLTKVLFSSHWSLQQALMYSKRNLETIRRLTNELQPDIIFVDMIRLAPYGAAFTKLKCRKVLNVADLLSERYKRQLQAKNGDAAILGQYGEKASWVLLSLSKLKALNSIALRFERRRICTAEIFYSRQFDRVLLVSPVEVQEFVRLLGADKVLHMPLCVDYEFLSSGELLQKEPDTISFIGNMAIAANIDTMSVLANKLMPLLIERIPSIRLKVIGNCPDVIRAQYKENKHIRFLGLVEDLRTEVGSSMALVAPIAYGTGIKTKILEAMAMGVPVVTNEVGAEGIVAENDKDFIVRNNLNEMADAVCEIIRDSERNEFIGKAGQNIVRDHYQLKYLREAMVKLCEA